MRLLDIYPLSPSLTLLPPGVTEGRRGPAISLLRLQNLASPGRPSEQAAGQSHRGGAL